MHKSSKVRVKTPTTNREATAFANSPLSLCKTNSSLFLKLFSYLIDKTLLLPCSCVHKPRCCALMHVRYLIGWPACLYNSRTSYMRSVPLSPGNLFRVWGRKLPVQRRAFAQCRHHFHLTGAKITAFTLKLKTVKKQKEWRPQGTKQTGLTLTFPSCWQAFNNCE